MNNLLPVMVGALLLSVLSVSCEPRTFARGVEYVNQTNKKVAVYEGPTRSFELAPRQVITNVGTIVAYPEIFFQVRDETGNLIFELKTTPKELEKAGWRIVITDQTLTPTPSPLARPP